MVKSLIERENIFDNILVIIYIDMVKGDKIIIYFMLKGFGSENKSVFCMLIFVDGVEGIEKFVVEIVKKVGFDLCLLILVGVGIGGIFEFAVFLFKKVFLRKVGQRYYKKYLVEFEERFFERINFFGIGFEGFGGKIIVLDVFIEEFFIYIVGFLVVVNICCYVVRYVRIEI